MIASLPIRVLVVDDHPVVRDGIRALLDRQEDMVVAGEAADGREGVEQFHALSPDVTLMDMRMRGVGGIGAIEAIHATSPEAKILVLTTYSASAQVAHAMRAGAAGFLLKNCIRTELLDAIRTVHAGRHALSPEVAHELALHALDEPLTPRELEVLGLVAEGFANKQIGSRLQLSTDTIKWLLKAIFAKLGVDDRTHAVTVAVRRGYIER